jgi:hypothetical protein
MTTEKRKGVKRYKPEEIIKYLKEWKASGKSQIAFSKEQGINYYTLNKWINDRSSRIKKPKGSCGGFAQLAVGGESASLPFAEVKREGITILFHQPVTPDFLRTLIK